MAPTERDTGWGWVIVGGAFTIQMLFGCVLRGFGVLYLRLLVRYSASANATAWVGTSMLICMGLTGPIGGWLMQRFSCRSVGITGSIIMSCGIIATGLVSSLNLSYITFGTAGIGLPLCYNASLVIIDKYFDKKKAKAIGMSTLGTAVGMFIFPPIMDFLFKHYGFTGGLLLFGGITLHGCIACSTFFPFQPHSVGEIHDSYGKSVISKTGTLNAESGQYVNTEAAHENNVLQQDQEIKKAKDITNDSKDDVTIEKMQRKEHIFTSKDQYHNRYIGGTQNVDASPNQSTSTSRKHCCSSFKSYISMCENPFLGAMVFFTFCQFCMGYCTAAFAPALALEVLGDISIEQASLSVTLFGATDALSKAIAALLFDLKGIRTYRTFIFTVICLLSAFSIVTLPHMKSYPMFLAACAMFGMLHGVPGGQRVTILSDLIEPEDMPSALGAMLLATSMGSISMGISMGLTRDCLGTYSIGFYIASLLMITCSIILLALLFIKKPRTWRVSGEKGHNELSV